QLSVWKPDRPLIDPFCASGTIPIEAAMIGRNIAPGLNRLFASQAWPMFDPSIWKDIRSEARALITPPLETKIIGSDIDSQSIEYARYHARRAGVADDIIFETKDFRDLSDSRPYGCIICNPPYGDRVGEHEDFRALYESMPMVLSKLPTWSHFIYTSWTDFEELIGQKATRRRKLFNSRIECTYFQFLGPRPPKEYSQQTESQLPDQTQSAQSQPSDSNEMTLPSGTESQSNLETQSSTKPEVQSVFVGLDDYAQHQLQEFTRCLQNRARHLRRYPKRGITCYRLYDRDFPEVPLAIDIFDGTWLHIAEYDRPDERSPAMHRVWLDTMVAAAASTLEILPENVFVKRRIRQRGESQYEKLAERRKIFTVHEGGLAFHCNMSDYLDVGLFLDHRITRDMVRKEANGKRFLNLFCYTGAFTCYAADGGASSSVSVDLSPTYLDWARDNLSLNEISERSPNGQTLHRFIKADTMAFLRSIPPTDDASSTESKYQTYDRNFGVDFSDFDLCVCDPPTYSNSKSTQEDWDVQRNHSELLQLLATRMTPGGVVYFSNNYRRFKLDEEALADVYHIREISARTVPEEYRNKRIHRCWRLVKIDK
ncbi:MAG: bifunctional 23S rRNA (guanine(2069)-N(7))-methyltransferase RlmK/23S rRNA (guanine(2445)-N(2))-methyltransferase RlmL, partial [Planctomycetia bacterium]|nr:bifunctional 23S rRNA (guanine(2069)-N(7))-methyltransferase RlmK/23S rRNA (guanine(2445)-N(2))-methyltransferase RlmL [Planctomycetia bacterium]